MDATMGEEDPEVQTDRPIEAAFRSRARRARAAVALASAAGCVVAAIAWRRELVEAAKASWEVGWWALWTLPLFWLWNHAASVGWRTLLPGSSERPSALRLGVIRIQAQAVNLVLPTGSVGGDIVRTALVAHRPGGWTRDAPPVALDTAASAVAGMLFSVAGLALFPSKSPGGVMAMALLLGLAVLLLCGVYFTPSLARLAVRRGWGRRRPTLQSLVRNLADSPARMRAAMRRCIGWHLVERVLMAVEVPVIAYGLGIRMTPAQVLFVAAVVTAISLLLFIVPGQVGAIEGGMSLAFAAVGLPPIAGLSVALVRRARQLAVMLSGFLILAISQGHASFRMTNHLAAAGATPARVPSTRRRK